MNYSGRGFQRQKTGIPKLLPSDFAAVIACLPDGCPIVGGQAVAWWATKYGITGKSSEPVTSVDIDFWGGREDLEQMARALDCRPIYPHKYEMTVWVGSIQIKVKGQQTMAEFIHFVPGLDIPYPEKASVEQEFRGPSVTKIIQVLTPVSLVLTKLHSLWRFDQKQRNDELHLKVSLKTCREFLSELLAQKEVRLVLRDCERLVTAQESSKAFRRLENQFDFSILKAIPLQKLRKAAVDQGQPPENRRRLTNFLDLRWPRVAKPTALPLKSKPSIRGRHGTK